MLTLINSAGSELDDVYIEVQRFDAPRDPWTRLRMVNGSNRHLRSGVRFRYRLHRFRSRYPTQVDLIPKAGPEWVEAGIPYRIIVEERVR